MTNALFARGTVAVTAGVKVRYWRPLPVGGCAVAVGEVTRCEPPLYLTEARITSGETFFCSGNGEVHARPRRRAHAGPVMVPGRPERT